MSFTFWVTSNCNLNCKYCYEGADKENKSMTRDTVDRTIEFIFNHLNNIMAEKLHISIHGGEPFLEFDLIKYIVSRVKESCIDKKLSAIFFTTTNATLLNNQMIDFIVEEIPDITVSIDGRKETHDKLRSFKGGQGSHDIVLENSLKLLKRLPNIRVRMTFDSDTVYNLYENVKYIIDNGFKIIVPAPNLFDRKWDTNHVQVLKEQMNLIKEYIKDKSFVAVSIVDKEIYSVKSKCNGGKTSFHIYPDGKLYPCIMAVGKDEFCIGDIFKGINYERRDYLISLSNQENSDCIGCALYKSCDGTRCKIINKVITDDYNKPPLMHCAMENLKYKVN